MKGLIVCDMLNDFVTGSIGNPRSQRIIPHIDELLKLARENRDQWVTVFVNDAHLPNDFELKVWGPHAMAGTPGAQVIPELAPAEEEFVLGKRVYSCFHETGLDPLLRQYGVDHVVLVGQHTHICMRHTSADAFFRGYEITVPQDGVEAFTDEDHEGGLKYLRDIYKVDTPYTKELLEG
jgi:nicotinamidase-related amidase